MPMWLLNRDPKNAQAYLGKLMAEVKVREESALANPDIIFEEKQIIAKLYVLQMRLCTAKRKDMPLWELSTVKRNSRKLINAKKE